MSAQSMGTEVRSASARPKCRHRERSPTRIGARRGIVGTVIAMASIASGAMNIAAAASIPGLNGQSLAFFWTIGVAQVVWGLVTLVWAPRWWLALGALGNAVVAATWLVSRDGGAPVRPVPPATSYCPLGSPMPSPRSLR